MVMRSEQDYQAEWDAQTLAQAEQIKADKSRMTRATDAAKRLSEEKEQENRAMKKVAGKRTIPLPNGQSRLNNNMSQSIGKMSIPAGKSKDGVTTFIG